MDHKSGIDIIKSCFETDEDRPDTGDDSDEDLVTNYLTSNGSSTANNDGLVPTIHITPQSPNGNHVLGKSSFHH